MKLKRSQIKIDPFKITDIGSDSTIAIIAPRRSGKSVLVKDILYHLRDQFAYGFVVSTTEQLNRYYGEFVPDVFIHHEYDPAKIGAIIEQQKKVVKANGKRADNRMFIVLDDVLADANVWLNCNCVKDLFFNGRHFNCCFILSLQYCMSLKPAYRSNLDYTFVFYDKNVANQDRIYKNLSVGFENAAEFRAVFNKIGTHEYHSLVFANNSGLHYYKAAEHEEGFLLGDSHFWTYHQNKYDKSYYLREGKQNTNKKMSKVFKF